METSSMKKKYLLRVYDTFYNNVIREFVKEFDSNESAIASAMNHLHLMYRPADLIEIQVCVPTLGYDYQMIGYVAYENDNSNVVDLADIYYEECF